MPISTAVISSGLDHKNQLRTYTVLGQISFLARNRVRALSSVGRAPDLHSGGQEFDPPNVHHPFFFSFFEKFIGEKVLTD